MPNPQEMINVPKITTRCPLRLQAYARSTDATICVAQYAENLYLKYCLNSFQTFYVICKTV